MKISTTVRRLSLTFAIFAILCLADRSPSHAAIINGGNDTPISASKHEFSVDFNNCAEYAGLTPVLLSAARDLVPQPYAIAGAETGNATLVVRTAQCDAVRVDGAEAQPVVVSQVGINIVSPDGTGDINNYTLWYTTDSLQLAKSLQLAGVNAEFVPGLTYTVTPTGNFSLVVPSAASAPFTLSGTLTEPDPNDPGFPYVANWWQLGATTNVQMKTSFPNISFGSGDITLQTDPNSKLGAVIGSGSTKFTSLSVRGRFQYARLDVNATESPVSVPESSSGLGILAFGTFGVSLMLKLKPNQRHGNG